MNENAIHVKLGYEESASSKKTLLLMEMEILRAIQSIRKYKHLRTEELKAKTRLIKKIKETITDLRKMHRILPKVKINGLKKEDKETSKEKQKSKREEKYNLTLEQELQEIQKKLSYL